MKATWNVFNKVIKPDSRQENIPDHFTEHDVVHNNSKISANEFNLGLNMGANIENCINETSGNKIYETESRIMKSFYNGEISEYDIKSIVNK